MQIVVLVGVSLVSVDEVTSGDVIYAIDVGVEQQLSRIELYESTKYRHHASKYGSYLNVVSGVYGVQGSSHKRESLTGVAYLWRRY